MSSRLQTSNGINAVSEKEKMLQGPLRMQAVQTPIIPVVGELIKSCPGTISLGQGVVYYAPPPQAIAQINRFLADPENHKYKLVQGIPPLLEAITRKLATENKVLLGPASHVVVTAGGNLAFMNAVLAITDPGDEVILQAPYYFNHEMAIAMAGCQAVLVSTDENYQLRPAAISQAITPKTKAVVTVSPNNPTGAVYPQKALCQVNRICAEAGIYHISDEAYESFTYDGAEHFSPGSISGADRHTISLFSLSKAYGFASWRIGYMVIPDQLFVSIKKIQDTLLICPPVISQYAAIGAFEAGSAYCREKIEPIREVREVFLNELSSLRSICAVPAANGAFYLLLKLATKWNAMQLVERLIRDYGVAVIPGTAFGAEEECYLRVAYGALEKPMAAEGLGRLIRGLKAIC